MTYTPKDRETFDQRSLDIDQGSGSIESALPGYGHQCTFIDVLIRTAPRHSYQGVMVSRSWLYKVSRVTAW